MGGGGGAVRLEPAPVMPEQRCFLLRPSNRDAEIVVSAQAERSLRQVLEKFLDLSVINRFADDGIGVRDLVALGQRPQALLMGWTAPATASTP